MRASSHPTPNYRSLTHGEQQTRHHDNSFPTLLFSSPALTKPLSLLHSLFLVSKYGLPHALGRIIDALHRFADLVSHPTDLFRVLMMEAMQRFERRKTIVAAVVVLILSVAGAALTALTSFAAPSSGVMCAGTRRGMGVRTGWDGRGRGG